KGLDAVYIGPADLSFALGLPPGPDKTDPVHLSTCDKIRDTAHKHGIKAVMHCASAAFAAGAVERGFDMIMLTADLASMIAGVRRQLDGLKAATACPRPRGGDGSHTVLHQNRKGSACRSPRPAPARPLAGRGTRGGLALRDRPGLHEGAGCLLARSLRLARPGGDAQPVPPVHGAGRRYRCSLHPRARRGAGSASAPAVA